MSATVETWYGVVKYPAKHKETDATVTTTRTRAPAALLQAAAAKKDWPLSELVLIYWRCASPSKGEVAVG